MSKYPVPAEASKISEHCSRTERKRILIVEDDRLCLIVLRQLLTAQGHEILQASEGRDAFARARNERPDLILMDITLPDISGLDATRLLKNDDQTKNIPIIAVTAFISSEYEIKALESGCDAYISKPVNIDKLLRTVEFFLSSGVARLQ